MSHEGFLMLLEECEEKSVLLSNLDPKHDLLRFSFQDCPVGDFSKVDLALVQHFIPGEEGRTEAPSIEMKVTAFGAYHSHLETAIALANIKHLRERST